MARKHRKLFPTTSSNQTQDCSDFCDPSCPYNCYAFPYDYFPPPPPPISASQHSTTGNHISSYLIIIASLFTLVFFLVGFYVVKVKCYADLCGRRVNTGAPPQSDNNTEDELINNNQIDHPIWLISTVGLQQSIINSITVCKYKKGEGLIEGTECSVCLNEFREDETVRLLPKCNHAFHIPCIDTWLRSHTNCPLCRAGIVSNNVSPDTETAMSNLESLNQNGNISRRNQETRMEYTRNEGDLNNSVMSIATGVTENRVETGEAQEFTDEFISKGLENKNGNQQVLNDDIQAEMSSGHENSYSTGPGSYRIDHIEDETEPYEVNLLKQHGDYSTMFKKMRRSSVAEYLHLSPVLMKRSFSYSGRIVYTKNYWTRSLDSTHPYDRIESVLSSKHVHSFVEEYL